MSISKPIAFGLFFVVTQLVSCDAAANTTTQPLFPAILIFGDSTADTGNNNYYPQAVFKSKHLPYGVDLPGHQANGRFSNGKLISDVLSTITYLVYGLHRYVGVLIPAPTSTKLNIKEFVPPFLQPNISDQDIVTGVCFASAGAGYDDGTSLSSHAIPVSQQPSMFKDYISRLKGIVGDKKAMEIVNNALVVISAGPNDFILNFYDILTRRLQYPTIYGYQDFVLKRLDGFFRVQSHILFL
ncbi:PREDICTED: GDSL esterase/lipase At2g30220-like [Camelina sativa]|uniref:GDSL esterase/lipase At2g30220-like n=1 Tax=Camelina sativa TaxID=90675 RepID=A0ABM1Q716_CAMSA|nr:PREDICTED: GDSL esterase/lipase At2g30220-like [Camelina sativa]